MKHPNPKSDWNSKTGIPKVKQIIKIQGNLLETKKKILECYVISHILFGSEVSQMKN